MPLATYFPGFASTVSRPVGVCNGRYVTRGSYMMNLSGLHGGASFRFDAMQKPRWGKEVGDLK